MKVRFLIIPVLICFSHLTVVSQDVESLVKAKPFSWTGSVGTNMTVYSVKGIENRMNPFHYGFYGNFNMQIFEEFDIPVSFNYNQFGFDIQKPFYQFGISPKYKKIQLHLGHRNMFFNQYSLAGHTFFGAGIEFNPGKFRFAAMRGRLREPLLLDVTQSQNFTNPQFKRSGWGIKLGVGSFQNHIDLMLFKAKDDPMSIENWEENTYQNSIPGQTGKFAPAENMILGITSKWTLFKNISFGLEAGASLYTDDVTRESIDAPLPFFDIKSASVLKWAGKTYVNIPIKTFNLNAAYERIMPDYYSMGMYNFVNDMENITLSPGFSLWSGKASFNGMIGIQRNNLDGSRSESTKRLINNFSATIAPKPEYGIQLNYTNFSFNQQPQAILLNDTFLIKQINTSWSVMPYVNLSKDTSLQQTINGAYIVQNVEDLNPVTREFGNLSTKMITATYSFTNFKGYQVGGGLNYTSIDAALFTNVLQGVNLLAGRNKPKSGISVNLNCQINFTKVNGESDGTLISAGANGSVLFAEKHNFRLNLNWLRSDSKKFESYNELIFNMGYNFQIR